MKTASTTSNTRGSWITVAGARTNNLRNISVRVPKHRMTVFTGVSGSGKSSLAFGTIAAEAQRLVADSYPLFVRNRLPQHGPVDADRLDGLTFTVVVDQRPFSGNTRSTVGTASDTAPLLRMLFSRIGTPSAGYSPAYSFNDPSGMCPRCEGLGTVDDIDLACLIDDTRSLNEGAIRFPTFAPGTYRFKRMLHSGLIDPDLPLSCTPPETLDMLLHARQLRLTNPDPQYPKSGLFDGVIPRLRDSYLRKSPSRLTDDERTALSRIVSHEVCPECAGSRLNSAARASLIDGRSIADWSAMPIRKLRQTLQAVQETTVSPLLQALSAQLERLDAVGLGYLSLDRHSPTLSGGEAQRVKIVRYLGSALSDVCYIFDEPSAGLHPHDVHRLLQLLAQLRNAHNTVLVVEHHPAVVSAADHIIDLGPGAGSAGGTIQFEGTPAALSKTDTVTGHMLRAPMSINAHPRPHTRSVAINHATAHNLQDVSVRVPLRVLTVVSGVAGSGKTTLMAGELGRQHPEFVVFGQGRLRGGTRSNAATVLGIAEPIRAAFALVGGIDPSWFSANGRGACTTCKGKGVMVTDLAFLEDVRTSCEACGGSRFNPTALAVTFAGRSIAEILATSAKDIVRIFASNKRIVQPLRWLVDVGLGYLSVGQSTSTLSGGERGRLLLAKHLAATEDPSQLRIVLDEPTVGLHAADTDRILRLFDRLVDAGATIVAIEHNLRVIAHADHVIDIGPGAGDQGGTVVYEGTPAGLRESPNSLTGQYL
ncbi:excinuclease ABC subunit UvrA [Leucobacter insecticola]|uniref:UvrABC system protein A n=1 Tax=Leucobacter insecticola TaxID=2714934 RepID=A0A6G8FGK5_9MICO|nr:excinuclease ABC subunit UvrA [Leucobacter insecticola]QIM15477.1 excinuclease ABC subunit UvrA [Leucobacter insecticola]